MVQESRLSAVAKRRRLLEAQSASASPIPATTPADRTTDPNEIAISDTSKNILDEILTDSQSNSFEPFVSSGLLQDIEDAREIQAVTPGSVKIRLRRDQRCSVSGIYLLWLKLGSISLMGANIEASTTLHTVYAPECLETPTILCISKIVEFQLESVEEFYIPPLFGRSRFIWTPPGFSDPITLSFLVHGLNLGANTNAGKPVKEFDIHQFNSVHHALPNNPNSTLRMMVCGRYVSGLNQQITRLINQLLTDVDKSGKERHKKGILLLDLDADHPSFGPPGMVSLVHITQPIFGPSFVYPVSTDYGPIRILTMYLVGHDKDAAAQEMIQKTLHNLDKMIPNMHNSCPIVLKISDWLEHLDPGQLDTTIKSLRLNTVVVGPQSSTTTSHNPVLNTAENQNISILHLQPFLSREPPVHLYYQTHLHSYLYAQPSQQSRQKWHAPPLLQTNSYVTLSYRPGGCIEAIQMEEHDVPYHLTAHAIEGCLMAIVVVPEETTNTLAKDEQNEPQSKPRSHSSRNKSMGIPRTSQTIESSDQSASTYDQRQCLGLAMITGIDLEREEMTLCTPASPSIVDNESRGRRIRLVTRRPDEHGRWSTVWLRRQIHHPLMKRTAQDGDRIA